MIDKNALFASATQACNLLKCLASPHRLLVVCHLMEGRKSAGELADLVGIGASNASQHLAQLRAHGIVTTEREAQTIYYSIASEPARQVLQVLYEQFCDDTGKGKRSKQKC